MPPSQDNRYCICVCVCVCVCVLLTEQITINLVPSNNTGLLSYIDVAQKADTVLNGLKSGCWKGSLPF